MTGTSLLLYRIGFPAHKLHNVELKTGGLLNIESHGSRAVMIEWVTYMM